MPELEPITREEMLLDGEDLTPITRKEKFIKRIYDKTQEIPEPVTREEMFLKKAGEGSGGDVTVEQLNVLENGTYSESGKAYSPVVVNVPQPTLTTLTATENRTYTAPAGTGYNEVNVNVPLPSNAYLLKELSNLPQPIASFSDGAEDLPLKSLTARIVPVQDLHGYDYPWVGGAGKNKLQVTATTQTINGVIFTVNDDGTVLVNGTASDIAVLIINNISNLGLTDGTEYILSGCNGGTSSTYKLDILQDSGAPAVINFNGDTAFTKSTILNREIRIVVYSGVTVNNQVFKPMIRLATVSDATFEPYSNICPISGWTEEVVTVTDDLQNPTVTHTTTIPFTDSQGNPVEVYGGSVDVVNGELTIPNSRTVKTFNGSENWIFFSSGCFYIENVFENVASDFQTSKSNPKCLCNFLNENNINASSASVPNMDDNSFANQAGYYINRLWVKMLSITTLEDFKTYLGNHNLQIDYPSPLATPITYQLTPTAIKSFDGENNVFASTGDVEELKYFSKEAE